MKRQILLVLSILFPVLTLSASENDNSKETIEKNVKEKSLQERLNEKGRVTTKESADTGRTTGGGRTAKVGKED